MKTTTIYLKLFPYLAGFICALAIIIFVLLQVSAIGWYAILAILIVAGFMIWTAALREVRMAHQINLDDVRILEDRLQTVEEQLFILQQSKKNEYAIRE